jgi:hypothetical protein
MALRDTVVAIGDSSERQVVGLWRSHTDEARFVAVAAALIARHNMRAVAAADLGIAAALAVQLRRPVAPLGLMIGVDDIDRLRGSVRTVLDTEVSSAATAEELFDSRAARLGRLARAEPFTRAQDTFTTAMQRHGVRGWRRVTSAKACPLCLSWADGVVRPATVRMARHTGCSCVAQPVAR